MFLLKFISIVVVPILVILFIFYGTLFGFDSIRNIIFFLYIKYLIFIHSYERDI